MVSSVLVQADGDVGGVSVLDGVGNRAIDLHDDGEHDGGQRCKPIHVDHEGLVRALRHAGLVERSLGSDTVVVLKERQTDNLGDR